MQVRMLIDVSGTFHNIDAGVCRGDVVDVDDATAARYFQHKIAEPLDAGGGEESAVLDTAGAESAVVKPRGGRRKRQPDWTDEKAPGWSEGNPPK